MQKIVLNSFQNETTNSGN